mgnify:FL=1
MIDISRIIIRTWLIFIGFLTHQTSHAIIVDVQFSGGSSSQQALFQQAANYWGNHLIGYQPGINIPNTVTINASIGPDDGPGGTLAYAGPTYVWSQQYTNGYIIAAEGDIFFDTADVPQLESNGNLYDVIRHEMAHVLGFGTLWEANGVYITGSGQYTGANALAAWQTEFNQPNATFIPVELEGGPGTAEGHWNENYGGSGSTGIVNSAQDDITSELMTGWLNASSFISNTTLMSFADIGYEVAPIPLPPAGYLLFSAFAGMGILKKRASERSA